MTTNNSKLLIALTKDTFITATKSKILDPTFSSTSELSITNIKTKDTTTHQCKSKFDHLFTFDSLTLGISENNTAEIYTDKLVATHEITSPFAFAYNPHKKLLAISNPLKLINTVDYKANICNFKHSFECLSWNNKVNHILASIADNRIIILDLKNKKEVVNVALENFKLSQANTIMWHWSELTSLIIGTKNGTYKINLSDGTASKISNYGEKVIFSDYLVCTDYKTVEFYDKDLNLVLSKEMNICDIDVNEENVAISYMDKKPEIMKKSRFVERYGGKKQKNLFYIDNKNVISLNEKYRVKNEIYEETSEPENLLIITSAMEGKDIDLEEYLVKEEDKEQSLKLATIRKILDKECFSDEEYKSMDNSLVLLLSEYGNDFKYIAENIEIEKWPNLVDTINKSNNNSKKLYYGILRERLEDKGMKKEAMIVCVFAQDFAKLYKMQVDLLVLPKCVEEINPFYAKFRCIVEKFKALNVDLKNEIYTSFLKWEEYNKNGSIESDLLKMKIDSKQAKPVGAVKQNMYNNANCNTYQKPNVYKPQTRNEETVNNSIPQMPNRPSFGNLQQKGSPQQSSMSYAQQNNVRPNIPFANTTRPSQPNMQTSPTQQNNTRTYPAQANTPQQNNVYQPGKALNANNLIPSFSPTENVQPAKPKMTYGDINKQQVKNVMGRPGLQMPTSNLRSPTTSQRPMQGVVPPIPTPRQPSADSSVMSQRPAQSAILSPSLRPPQMAKAPVSAPEFTVNPQKPMPSVRQNQNVNPPQTNNQQAGNAQNVLSETQKQEMMNGIQKKINFLITESSKKNGFFHKNKITSSMKRLQFYEINKEGFSDSLIINLHELLSMIDEEECTNMLDKFKAKTSEMNSAFGNSCGFDVFGLGLLGLYQVVLSEKK